MKDLFGKAIYNYYKGYSQEDLLTETSISEQDVLPLSYLFRSFEQMPYIEQKALRLCQGTVLDIGAGSGSHSIHLQESLKMEVTAIDISKGSIQCCKERGIKNTILRDVFTLEDKKFDTLLMLMNGSGIFGTYKDVPNKLNHLKKLLNPGGQILIDSSDIIYMFDQDDDGGYWIPNENDYYGELSYTISYQGESETSSWLFLDYSTLSSISNQCGFKCELIKEGDHYDYLARLNL